MPSPPPCPASPTPRTRTVSVDPKPTRVKASPLGFPEGPAPTSTTLGPQCSNKGSHGTAHYPAPVESVPPYHNPAPALWWPAMVRRFTSSSGPMPTHSEALASHPYRHATRGPEGGGGGLGLPGVGRSPVVELEQSPLGQWALCPVVGGSRDALAPGSPREQGGGLF